jgi:hypothetical protein
MRLNVAEAKNACQKLDRDSNPEPIALLLAQRQQNIVGSALPSVNGQL